MKTEPILHEFGFRLQRVIFFVSQNTTTQILKDSLPMVRQLYQRGIKIKMQLMS